MVFGVYFCRSSVDVSQHLILPDTIAIFQDMVGVICGFLRRSVDLCTSMGPRRPRGKSKAGTLCDRSIMLPEPTIFWNESFEKITASH